LGHQPADAQDLTQEFFARLLEKHYLRAADPERGRFRSFRLFRFKVQTPQDLGLFCCGVQAKN
jgi:RNA polymerase sigma-70 factor (ECF subfamily)